MPEGPELHLSSQFINEICKGRIFAGAVRKNPIHKCADVAWNAAAYMVSSVSRGKELKVFLQALKTEADEKTNGAHEAFDSKKVATERLHLLFNFGMTGKFEFTPVSELPKHAHLSFFTKSGEMALSFVDYRRFGKWQAGADWSPDRGPCVLFEYPLFRSHILNSLADSAFNKPVCEVLLNQKYFNGIGNYLRAEICYRAGVRPFDQARAVFSALPDVPEDVKPKVKSEEEIKEKAKPSVKTERPDILELCNTIPLEVVGLGTSLYLPEDEESDMSKFGMWVQCYYKPGMKNVADHNKRTMWYHGDPGPMLPKEGGLKRRHGVYDKKLSKGGKKMKKEQKEADQKEDDASREKKIKKTRKPSKENKQGSPTKPKRITRTSLKTLEEASSKKSQTAVKSRKAKSKKSPEGDDEVNNVSSKKTEGRQKPRKAKGNVELSEKNIKISVKRRATRGAVKESSVIE